MIPGRSGTTYCSSMYACLFVCRAVIPTNTSLVSKQALSIPSHPTRMKYPPLTTSVLSCGGNGNDNDDEMMMIHDDDDDDDAIYYPN